MGVVAPGKKNNGQMGFVLQQDEYFTFSTLRRLALCTTQTLTQLVRELSLLSINPPEREDDYPI